MYLKKSFKLLKEKIQKVKAQLAEKLLLRVVSSTITTANQSVSGTNAGNSIHATGNTVLQEML